MQKTLVVNAVSLYSGGGLIVLKQFLANIPDNNVFYIFVHYKTNLDMELPHNIKIIPIKFNNKLHKLLWGSLFLKQWLDRNNIKADTIISLQNTSIKYNKNVQQIIYLHNALALHNHSWSWYKPAEFKVLLYKWFNAIFMFLHWHGNSKIVVQTEWMRKQLLAKYKWLNNKVIVIKPNIKDFDVDFDGIKDIKLRHEVSLFYPCSSQPFKNHIEIVNALIYLKEQGQDISDIGYYLTISKSDCPMLVQIIERHNLLANVVFLGALPYSEVLRYYKACSMVVFPSKIESCGLPLLEGMLFKKPLIALADSYAKDTVAGYENVIFAGEGQSKQWAQAIMDLRMKDSQYVVVEPKESSWKEFFAVVHQ